MQNGFSFTLVTMVKVILTCCKPVWIVDATERYEDLDSAKECNCLVIIVRCRGRNTKQDPDLILKIICVNTCVYVCGYIVLEVKMSKEENQRSL